MFVYNTIPVFLLSYTVYAKRQENGTWEIFNNLIINYNTHDDNTTSEDALFNITQLVTKYGYDFQEHTVDTEDGYVINVHRVLKKNKSQMGPVVFLMHGIMESSDSWVLLGPNRSLAYLLADREYDVWLGNARGNKHALKHISMTPMEPDFWNFTWEEIGLYDLPAMINYILSETGERSIYYVGHSQGTTVFYVMCSMKPEYNTAIRKMFSLAPVAWMGNIRSPLVKTFSPANGLAEYLLKDIKMYISGTDLFKNIASIACSISPRSCTNYNILFLISGPSDKITDSMMTVISGHMPTGSSTLQFIHYGQLVFSKQFSRFNHGAFRNMILYGGSIYAPAYDLSKVVAPVVIFFSGDDMLSHPIDVEMLLIHLTNKYVIYIDNFSHLDYIYANEAVYIYERIIIEIIKTENTLLYPTL